MIAVLPDDIREDLARRRNDIFGGERMADSDATLLRTDAPAATERNHVLLRFAQAMRVRDIWFVQYEVSLGGLRMISYVRHPDGRFNLSPAHHFGGPACASIKAALSGVRSPGGF